MNARTIKIVEWESMTERGKSGKGATLNLGLSVLAGGASAPIDDAKIVEKLNSSIDWVERELERNVVPRSILAERLIALAPGLSQQRDSTGLQSAPYKRLESLVSRLSERLHDDSKQDFEQRFLAASQEKPKPIVAEVEEPPHAPVVESAPFVMGEQRSEWEKFADVVKSVGNNRDGGATEAVPVAPSRSSFFRSRTVLAIGSIVLLLLFLSYKRVPSEVVALNQAFVRVDEYKALTKISDDTLVLPALAPLVQVSTLSSLVSEIQANPLPTPSVRAPRNVQPQSPSDDRLEAIPVPASDEQKPVLRPAAKEVLKIEASTEPAAVRDLQVQPEVPVRENTFDFPPFLNRPQPTAGSQGAANMGSDVDGRPVVHFSNPRRYSITAATQVMARPSYWAPRMGVHDPGDTVSVDAIIGVWLRIRDDDGNSGYILSQDAAPEMRASR